MATVVPWNTEATASHVASGRRRAPCPAPVRKPSAGSAGVDGVLVVVSAAGRLVEDDDVGERAARVDPRPGGCGPRVIPGSRSGNAGRASASSTSRWRRYRARLRSARWSKPWRTDDPGLIVAIGSTPDGGGHPARLAGAPGQDLAGGADDQRVAEVDGAAGVDARRRWGRRRRRGCRRPGPGWSAPRCRRPAGTPTAAPRPRPRGPASMRTSSGKSPSKQMTLPDAAERRWRRRSTSSPAVTHACSRGEQVGLAVGAEHVGRSGPMTAAAL